MTSWETSVLWKSALIDEMSAQEFASVHNVPIRVAKWCMVRGIEHHQVGEWFAPTEGTVASSVVFDDMEQAVCRIKEAISSNERICIVGDYDVDGVTSSAILCSTLEFLKASWIVKIPHRVEDGYGLSTSIVDYAARENCGLLITVDNGIRANEAIEHAVSLGLDVIVTDHHEPGPKLPRGAHSIVHYARCSAPSQANLSGAGVAWKVAMHLLDSCGYSNVPADDSYELRSWHLGLAALGALADVMPLKGENRFIVHAGVRNLVKSKRPGWKALCEVAQVDCARCTATTVLWNITPRLNAAGRMDSAAVAFELLMASEDAPAIRYAQVIEHLNSQRRLETDRIYNEAVAAVSLRYQGDIPGGIVVHGRWNLGVVGIVAAKLVSLYHRPVIVLSEEDSGVCRGSGRAPDGFPLHSTVERCQEYLEHFGGHESAIGCGVPRDKLEPFAQKFADAAATSLHLIQEQSKLPQADDYLPLSEATLELFRLTEMFAPFGPENEKIRFYVGPVEIRSVTSMGGGKHLRLKVREGEAELELVWFSALEEAFSWSQGDIICAVVSLDENRWKGVSRLQLMVESAVRLQRPLLRRDFTYFYKLLASRRRLQSEEVLQTLPERTIEEKKVIFDTFVELGFAHFDERAYHVIERVVPRDLREAPSYHKHLRSAIGGP